MTYNKAEIGSEYSPQKRQRKQDYECKLNQGIIGISTLHRADEDFTPVKLIRTGCREEVSEGLCKSE